MKTTLLCLLLLVCLNPAEAQWSSDPTINTPVQTSAEDDFNDLMVSDGSGGAFVFYKLSSTDPQTLRDIDVLYVKRLKADGTLAWGTQSSGTLVCNAGNDRYFFGAVPDGTGGVIVAWVDYRDIDAGDVYIQRFNSSGTALWGNNGKAVTSTVPTDEYDGYIVSDGAGGVIVAWSWDNTTSDIQASAQRFDANGNAMWTSGGVKLINNAGFRYMASMVSDGAGGAIAVMVDYRKDPDGNNYNLFDPVTSALDSDIFAQRINGSGSLLWGAGGAVVCNEAKNQGDIYRGSNARALEDGSGGVVVFFADYRNDELGIDGFPTWENDDVYAQRLNSSGVRQWTSSGVSVTNLSRKQYSISAVRTSGGNYAVAYYDETPSVNKALGQLLSSSGTLLWPTPVNIVGNSKVLSLRLMNDLSGNVICIYINDLQNGTLTSVRGQKFNTAGATQWTSSGLAIASNASSFPVFPRVVNSESETLVVTWRDFRSTATKADIYGAKVAPNGTLTTWAGGPIISAANGNWNNSATWQSGIMPASGSEVIIRHTVTVTAATAARKVTVENPNGNLRLNPGISVTVSQ
jgi:hypothetical protein